MRLMIIFLFIFSCSPQNQEPQFSEAQLKSLRSAQSEYEKNYRTYKKTEIKSGQGLFQALSDININGQEALDIINNLRDEVEFSKIQLGDKLSAGLDFKGDLIEFNFSSNPAEIHQLYKVDGEFSYRFVEKETKWESRLISGVLTKGSTLQADLLAQGLSRSVVAEVVNVLLCKVHFRMDARVGDVFEVLLNERKLKDTTVETDVLYTSYKGYRAGNHEAFYFKDDNDKKSTYTAHYTRDGEALIRSGLRYPLKRLHIRSGYGYRRHPVTGKRKMHRGVDLRARIGTPVHAVAKGVVVDSSYNKYAGHKVVVLHSDNSRSYYLHLNKRKVKLGQRVRSHQVIGTVGKSGRVTGPHLHFGFRRSNGSWMNPMKKRMIATPKLKGKELEQLNIQITSIQSLLDNHRSNIAKNDSSDLKAL